MPEDCGHCKANPVDIARNTRGTPTAKLIAILIAHGVTDTRELAEATGLTTRAVQIARATHFAKPISHPPETHFAEAKPISPSETHFAKPISPLARAYKESPSEIVIPSKLDSPLAPHEAEKAVDTTAQSPPRKPSSGTTRGRRLEPDWQLPADWRMWARTNFPGASVEQIDDQAARFRDYWIAKPGAQACKLDWEATWRNWCRTGLSPLGNVRKPASTGVWADGRKRLDLSKIKTYDYDPSTEAVQ